MNTTGQDSNTGGYSYNGTETDNGGEVSVPSALLTTVQGFSNTSGTNAPDTVQPTTVDAVVETETPNTTQDTGTGLNTASAARNSSSASGTGGALNTNAGPDMTSAGPDTTNAGPDMTSAGPDTTSSDPDMTSSASNVTSSAQN